MEEMRRMRLLSGEMRAVAVGSPDFLSCLSGCPSLEGLDDGARTQGSGRFSVTEGFA